MYVPKHSNYIKASNLMFGTVALSLINFLVFPDYLSSTKNIIVSLVSLAFVVGISFLVRQGIDWLKYLLLVLFIIGCIGLPFTITNFSERPLLSMIGILQTVLQLWAIVLLFKIPAIQKINSTQQFEDNLNGKGSGSL
jgi:asparagine N-glycosylation enzyme membrane subunit Stt3